MFKIDIDNELHLELVHPSDALLKREWKEKLKGKKC